MKKIMFLIVALLIVPVCVFAATSPEVIKLDANVSGKDIKYSGETTDGAYAVMCKLFNSKDEELDMLSSPVDDNKFDGSFTVTENGDYKVACAIYEGGNFKTVDVTVSDAATKEANPKTYDNVVYYIIILAGCATLLGASYLVRKRLS